ncbi:Peptidase aspartic [Penicillium cf. viridicatum]|uniref:Peptidase aspartic n=1 Tax=Penicillium cf. viridicatum TaxID=2972119 RepID=A0A9W9JAW0_9EURO|nr:Peptidase aspartic [Penicillium cf. viridicatum]
MTTRISFSQLRRSRIGIILLLFALLDFGSAETLPWVMRWSPKGFGPDGPWNAVLVELGSAKEQIALYPGAWWTSYIILSSYCSNFTISSYCYADDAGTFSAQSTTWDNTSIQYVPDGTWGSLDISQTNAIPVYGKAHRSTDMMSLFGTDIPSSNLITVQDGYQTYPGGNNYPLEVGTLALGAQYMNQTFGDIGGTIATGWLWNGSKTIESYTYGMHIGSSSLGIPGSLMLGGYDQSRVLGDVSVQPHTGSSAPINLLDVSLGVATGSSPWNSPSKEGLLAQGNSSLLGGTTVIAAPVDPYLYLPRSSCDAIAAELPVTHNSDLGLYTWNTDDPHYQNIITSPSYLAFTFTKDNTNTQNFTIKVPFALLNLTLDSPLVDRPMAYFPCYGTEGRYALGRAFLQAAFIGANMKIGATNWFLAQAPGPGYARTASKTILAEDATTLASSHNDWEASWSAHWTPLASNGTISKNSTSSENSSTGATTSKASESSDSECLSLGAKAGIGAGCGAAGLLLATLLVFWLVRRRRRQKRDPAQETAAYDALAAQQASMVHISNGSSFQHNSTGWAKPLPRIELDDNSPYQGPFEMGPGKTYSMKYQREL